MEQSKMIIKRNLLFWGKYGVQMTAILMGFVILYGFFFSLGNSADDGFWQNANLFAILIGIMFNYIGPISYAGAYVPMVISFGSGRKEAAWGAQLLYAVYAVTSYLFILFTGYMSVGRLEGFKNILIAEAFLFCIAFGQICAVLQMHYGKKGMAVGIIITIAVVFFVGAGFVTGVGFCDTVIAWVESLSGSIVAGVLVIGAVAAAVFYVISLVVMLRVVSKYEVRV
ncbi:MAG TPA: membrane-spanning protein [Roseburia sp.]|nr:membrane-spanning protein [Roseburia sp.]